jgi:tape measure domain-containing protein
MTEYARLVVAVDSTQAAKARAELDKLPGSARKASSAADGLTSSFKKLGGVLATYFSVREVVRAAEAYTTINNRLRLVTASSEQFAQAQADLFRIAQNSRQPLTETAELYQRIATNQKELGLTGDGVARITEVINKSLAVSGTSASAAAGALTQLGQAFASGQLRGEELNSVLENAPALAQALARGMGVTVGQLRALGAEGKISAQAVVDALLSQGEALDQQFATLAPTVSGAMTTVGNAFVQLVGQMDQTTGASANAAAEIMKLADILSDPATVKAAQDLAAGIATALGWVVEAATSTVGAVQWMAEELAVLFNGIGLHDIDRLEQEASRLQELLNKMEQRGETGYAIYGSTKESYDKVKRQLDQAYELADLASTLQSGSGSPVPAAAAQRPALRMASSGTGVVEKEISNSKALQAQLKAELAAKRELTAQEQIRIDILRESGQLRAANDAQFQLEYAEKIAEYERQGNVEALQRLETLRRIREVQMNADQAPGTVEGVTKAPNSGVVSPEIGGAASEFMRLQEQAAQLEEWRATELEKQRGFLEAKAINEEQYAERVRNIQEQHQQQVEQLEQARYQVSLSSATDLFGNLADITAQFAGEQSGIYKAMFIAQKAFAIAQSMIAIQQGIALAAANPWPLNLGAMASVAAATAGLVSNIASVGLSFDGGGYTGNGPRSGGLDGKGGFLAMMHPQETVIDHTKQRGGPGNASDGGNVVVNLVEDSSRAGQVEQTTGPDGEKVLQLWVAKIRAGGTPEALALEQAYGLKRAGR